MRKKPSLDEIEKGIAGFAIQQAMLIENPDDFIFLNTAKDNNPLIFNNAYFKSVWFQDTWIKYVVGNYDIIGYCKFNTSKNYESDLIKSEQGRLTDKHVLIL